jgi:hypothetical protein
MFANRRRSIAIAILVLFTSAASAICGESLLDRLPTEQEKSAAQDEIYTIVIENLAPWRATQLVVSDKTLLDPYLPRNPVACHAEIVRQAQEFTDHRPPYQTIADKLYHLMTRRWDDVILRDDAVQDFAAKACTTVELSRSFHTDLPTTFVDANTIHFRTWENLFDSGSFEHLYPGAVGVLYLSAVGFDAHARQAIVDAGIAFQKGSVDRQRWVLQRREGNWEIVSQRRSW